MKYIPNYTNFQTLKNYALRYYFKYNTSIKKLESKLLEKSKDSKLSKEVLLDINSLLQEKYILDNQIRNLLEKGKSERFILNKLKLKGFLDTDIKEIISSFEESEIVYQSSRIQIKNEVENLLKRKPFKNIIFSLKQKGYNSDLVQEIIDEYGNYDQSCLIESTIQKLKTIGTEKEKIISKLLQKGFDYREIKKFMV